MKISNLWEDPGQDDYYSVENWEVIPFPTAQAHTCLPESKRAGPEKSSPKYLISDMDLIDLGEGEPEPEKPGTSKDGPKPVENIYPEKPPDSQNPASIVHPLPPVQNPQFMPPVMYPVYQNPFYHNMQNRYPYYM